MDFIVQTFQVSTFSVQGCSVLGESRKQQFRIFKLHLIKLHIYSNFNVIKAMLTIDKFLFKYSLEQGGYVIGWVVLILSMMAFYVNFYLLVASSFATPDMLKSYLMGTIFENIPKQGQKLKVLTWKFNKFHHFLDFITFMIVFLVLLGVTVIVSFLLIQAVEAVSWQIKKAGKFI